MNREEATEIVRSIYRTDKEKEALETLIPELRESEDERIRMALVDHFAPPVPFTEVRGVPIQKVRDWLEKQKEQILLSIGAASEWLRKHVCNYVNSEYNEFHKCVEYDGSIDKERLINDFEEAMQKEQKPLSRLFGQIHDSIMWDMGLRDGIELEKKKKSLRDFIDDFPYSCEQEEQKPADNVSKEEYVKKFKALCDAYEIKLPNREYDIYHLCDDLSKLSVDSGKQKPWEWSEEERKILDSIIDDYEKAARSFCGYDGKIGLLRAIRDGEYNLPKPAWSEEDEKLFWGFAAYVPNEELERLGVTRDGILKKLKSLRPQPKQETE